MITTIKALEATLRTGRTIARLDSETIWKMVDTGERVSLRAVKSLLKKDRLRVIQNDLLDNPAQYSLVP